MHKHELFGELAVISCDLNKEWEGWETGVSKERPEKWDETMGGLPTA